MRTSCAAGVAMPTAWAMAHAASSQAMTSHWSPGWDSLARSRRSPSQTDALGRAPPREPEPASRSSFTWGVPASSLATLRLAARSSGSCTRGGTGADCARRPLPGSQKRRDPSRVPSNTPTRKSTSSSCRSGSPVARCLSRCARLMRSRPSGRGRNRGSCQGAPTGEWPSGLGAAWSRGHRRAPFWPDRHRRRRTWWTLRRGAM